MSATLTKQIISGTKDAMWAQLKPDAPLATLSEQDVLAFFQSCDIELPSQFSKHSPDRDDLLMLPNDTRATNKTRNTCALAKYAKCECDCRCGRLAKGLTSKAIVETASIMFNLSHEQYTFPMSKLTDNAFNGRVLPRWWQLDDNRLAEMENADKWLWAPYVTDNNVTSFGDIFYQSCNWRQRRARTFINATMEMTKQLSCFRDINHHDQIILFKAGFIQGMVMHYIQRYNYETDTMTIESNPEPFKMVTMKQWNSPMYHFYRRFWNTLDPLMLKDKSLMMLMYCVTFFNPNRQNLIDPLSIAHVRTLFENIIKRHIQCCYDDTDRYIYLFNVIMSKSDELDSVKEIVFAEHIRIINSVPIEEVDPLVLEMFGGMEIRA